MDTSILLRLFFPAGTNLPLDMVQGIRRICMEILSAYIKHEYWGTACPRARLWKSTAYTSSAPQECKAVK